MLPRTTTPPGNAAKTRPLGRCCVADNDFIEGWARDDDEHHSAGFGSQLPASADARSGLCCGHSARLVPLEPCARVGQSRRRETTGNDGNDPHQKCAIGSSPLPPTDELLVATVWLLANF